jgi:hypothetical protein
MIVLLILLLNLSLSLIGDVVRAAPVLDLSIATDKQFYNVGETIKITGNVTLDGVLQNDTLAAVEIEDVYGNPYVIRTVDTGNITGKPWWIQIIDLYTSDSHGTPKTTFVRDDFHPAYFNVTIANTHPANTIHTKGAVYIQTSRNTPLLAFYPFETDINPQSTVQFLMPFFLQSYAPTGQARLFINVLSDSVQNLGYALCPERSVNFSIETSVPQMPQVPSHFDVTFSLPSTGMKLGNYTLYATTNYGVQTAIRINNLPIKLTGDIVKDGIINIRDLTACILLFLTTPNSPNWNPDADTNNDQKVDLRDITFVILNFQRSGVY